MTKLEAKPFALVGVNVIHEEPKKVKEAIEKNQLNWRSFADKGNAITEKWNSPGTPTYYVLDHKGVIRFKWVGVPGAKAMDAAVEKLVAEAEKEREKSPR